MGEKIEQLQNSNGWWRTVLVSLVVAVVGCIVTASVTYGMGSRGYVDQRVAAASAADAAAIAVVAATAKEALATHAAQPVHPMGVKRDEFDKVCNRLDGLQTAFDAMKGDVAAVRSDVRLIAYTLQIDTAPRPGTRMKGGR